MMQRSFSWVLVFIFLTGCGRSAPEVRRYSKLGEFFGSVVKVDVCYRDEEEPRLQQALDEVWTRFADIHSRMSVYDPDSDINKINRAYDEGVEVGADTYGLIREALEYHRISQGVFDISVGPLIVLWKESGRKGTLPSAEEVGAARVMTGIDAVELLPDNRVRLRKTGVKINIDSIGDGYAADEAARILRSFGFENFLVDASGELYAGGQSCQGRPWRVGVIDPNDTSRLVDVVELSDMAVSTSGNYEHYYEIEGKRWSHIIDPATGYPSDDISSATVIAPTARFADFLSTALCVLDPAEGQKIVEDLGESYASMVIFGPPEGQAGMAMSRNYTGFRLQNNN
jgi:thiamine biosynthesis lipoprotein